MLSNGSVVSYTILWIIKKNVNVYRIFVNEYIKRIKENKTLQKCTFLMKVKNCILKENK